MAGAAVSEPSAYELLCQVEGILRAHQQHIENLLAIIERRKQEGA